MPMDNAELERRVKQNKADVDAIYGMLSVISATQTHHGRSLADVEATVAQLDVRLTARLDGVDTRLDRVDGRLDGIDGRLAGIDGRLAGIDGRLDGMDGRLGRLEDGMTEVLRRLPA